MIETRELRIVARDGGYILETRRAGNWHREVGCDTLDEAVETAARQQVERRFRSGHHRIPLSDRTALVCVPQRWWLETKSRGRGEATRGKSWPNIYRALSSGTRGGIAGQHADPIRRALWDVHLETVAALPDAAVEPRHAVRAALDRRPIPLAREVAQTLRVSPPASNAKSRWRCAHRPPE